MKIALVSVGKSTSNGFESSIDRYCNFEKFNIDKNASKQKLDSIISELSRFNTIIFSVYEMNQNPYQNFGLPIEIDLLTKILYPEKKIILNVFGNPYFIN